MHRPTPYARARPGFRQRPGRSSDQALAPPPADPPAHLLDRPPPVSAELVEHLTDLWHLLVRTDNLLGPRVALPAVEQQARLIEDVLPSARGTVRQSLLRLGSWYAESASWLCEDAGRLPAASPWLTRATEWAHESGDQVMLAWTLFRRSQHAHAHRDAAAVVGLARAACRDSGDLALAIRAAALQQEAHGHALDGDEIACHRALDAAAAIAASPEQDGDARSGHGEFCTATYIEIQRGACWLELGHPVRAAAILRHAIGELPTVYRRDRGVYLARLAGALAARGEPDEAVEVALDSLSMARRTGSGRALEHVREVDRLLSRSAPSASALRLRDALSASS